MANMRRRRYRLVNLGKRKGLFGFVLASVADGMEK